MKIQILTILSISLSSNILSSINRYDAQKIGNLIWKNECSNRVDQLVFWNQYEEFPSLGIGHFIWIPQNKTSSFTSQFPKLCNYMKKNGICLPPWLDQALAFGAPWKNREEFYKDSSHTDELRKLLSSTIDLQTSFMIEQLDEQWPKIINSIQYEKQEQTNNYYLLMRKTFLGNYTLIDYLNFKGSGVNQNQDGWGLLQVFLNMPDGLTKDNVNKGFAISATQVLLNRIKKSYPDYKIIRFMHGWIKRISTYYDENL